MAQKQKEIPIQQVVNALLDASVPFPSGYLRRFSDLEGAELAAIQQAWPQVNPTRRIALMEDFVELTETDTLVMFDNFARTALVDPEPGVRARAITLLWEAEDRSLIESFLSLVHQDPSGEVRAAAASALGKFIYLGELEELPEDLLHRIEDRLIEVALDAGALDVKDNGVGFAVPASPTDFAPSGHFGLLGMRERAQLIGARLEVSSRPGRGTELSVSLPYRLAPA